MVLSNVSFRNVSEIRNPTIFQKIESISNKDPDLEIEFKDVEADYQFEMLGLDGTWQPRRVVWSKESILFCKLGENRILDSIPLSEVVEIFASDSTRSRRGRAEKGGERDSIHSSNRLKRNSEFDRSLEEVHPHETRKTNLTKSKSSGNGEETEISCTLGYIGPTQKENPSCGQSNSEVPELVQSPPSLGLSGKIGAESIHTCSPMESLTGSMQSPTIRALPGKVSDLVQIKTKADGFNSGRTYYIRVGDSELCVAISADLSFKAKLARIRAERRSKFRTVQHKMRKIYNAQIFQSAVAVMIVANFAVSVSQAELNQSLLDDKGGLTTTGRLLERIEIGFTALFTLELCFNACAHWFRRFVHNGYNFVDLAAISLSLVALGPLDINFSVLRLIRACRVVRLFGRFKSIRGIVSALAASLVPVVNAFVIMFLIIAIYSIVGVTYLAGDAPTEFGAFSRAFLTLFRISAGDAWPDEALPLLNAAGHLNFGTVSFMTSYTIVVNWTLLQVSVAVLLNSFIMSAEAAEKAEHRQSLAAKKVVHTLDPLLGSLTESYVDEADLSDRLRMLFQVLNTDDSETLSCSELCNEMKKLDFEPRIHLTASDFAVITDHGRLCDDRGELGPSQFEEAMRKQIRLFAQRQLADTLLDDRLESAQVASLTTLKLVLLDLCSHSTSFGLHPSAATRHSNNKDAATGLPVRSASAEGGSDEDGGMAAAATAAAGWDAWRALHKTQEDVREVLRLTRMVWEESLALGLSPAAPPPFSDSFPSNAVAGDLREGEKLEPVPIEDWGSNPNSRLVVRGRGWRALAAARSRLRGMFASPSARAASMPLPRLATATPTPPPLAATALRRSASVAAFRPALRAPTPSRNTDGENAPRVAGGLSVAGLRRGSSSLPASRVAELLPMLVGLPRPSPDEPPRGGGGGSDRGGNGGTISTAFNVESLTGAMCDAKADSTVRGVAAGRGMGALPEAAAAATAASAAGIDAVAVSLASGSGGPAATNTRGDDVTRVAADVQPDGGDGGGSYGDGGRSADQEEAAGARRGGGKTEGDKKAMGGGGGGCGDGGISGGSNTARRPLSPTPAEPPSDPLATPPRLRAAEARRVLEAASAASASAAPSPAAKIASAAQRENTAARGALAADVALAQAGLVDADVDMTGVAAESAAEGLGANAAAASPPPAPPPSPVAAAEADTTLTQGEMAAEYGGSESRLATASPAAAVAEAT